MNCGTSRGRGSWTGRTPGRTALSFLEALAAELRNRNPSKKLNYPEIEFARRQIDQWVRGRLQPDQREALHVTDDLQDAAVVGWVVFAIVATPVFLIANMARDLGGAFLMAVTAGVVFNRAVKWTGLNTALGLMGTAVLPIAAQRFVAFLFARKRPGHHLRWVALLVFVIGFHFDLLAS